MFLFRLVITYGCFYVGIELGDSIYLKSFFTLDNGGSVAIGHLQNFNNPCHGTHFI